MKTSTSQTPQLAWYRVPELWLILTLLGATVVGSFALLVTAIRSPDAHIVVPEDVPRPNAIPPTLPADTPNGAGQGSVQPP